MALAIRTLFEESNTKVSEFMRREWYSSNLLNFGRNIPDDEWKRPFMVLAYLNDELVGVARCNVVGQTVRLSQLLVKTEYRKKLKIGTNILNEIERLCIDNGWHKIRLSTSKKHNNLDFYLKNGYQVEATLENDAFGLEWYIVAKFIEIRC